MCPGHCSVLEQGEHFYMVLQFPFGPCTSPNLVPMQCEYTVRQWALTGVALNITKFCPLGNELFTAVHLVWYLCTVAKELFDRFVWPSELQSGDGCSCKCGWSSRWE